MTHTRIEKTIFIKAKPNKVWSYLTKKDKLSEWFQPAKANLKQGAKYVLFNDAGEDLCWGKVVIADKPNTLVYTFTHNWLKGVETTVEWHLSEVHGGTMVKLNHYGFEDAPVDTFEMLLSHDKGWDDHFSRLREQAAE